MGGPVVREARPDEFDAVAEFLLAAYRQYSPPRDHPDIAAWDGYFADIANVQSRLVDSILLVLHEDGRLLGSVTYYPSGPVPDQPGATREGWPPEWAAFRLLGVHPDARGRGYGRALTEDCLRRARAEGAKAMGLHTTEFMEVARAMYERMGFERVPEHDFHPAPSVTVMAYRLEL